MNILIDNFIIYKSQIIINNIFRLMHIPNLYKIFHHILKYKRIKDKVIKYNVIKYKIIKYKIIKYKVIKYKIVKDKMIKNNLLI